MSRELERIPNASRKLASNGRRAACPCGRVVRVRGKPPRYWRHRAWMQFAAGVKVPWCKWSNEVVNRQRLTEPMP